MKSKRASRCAFAVARPRCPLLIPCGGSDAEQTGACHWKLIWDASSLLVRTGARGTKALWTGAQRSALFPPEHHVFVEHGHGQHGGCQGQWCGHQEAWEKTTAELRGCPSAKSDALERRLRPALYLKASPWKSGHSAEHSRNR